MSNSIEHYSTGCAFNLSQILMTFPYKKLKINCAQCKAITGDNHRDKIVKRVFRACLKLVIEDIVNNNVTFWLPLTGNRRCNLHMQRVDGVAFQKLKRAGKWPGLDFLKSNFIGYQLCFYMYGKRTPRVKNVYLNKEYRETIIRNINNGMQYGDSNKDKTIKDYYEALSKLFPTICEKDIKQILTFSWKSLYLHNSYGGDLVIKDDKLWMYVGKLNHNSLEHFQYYIKKLYTKLRVLRRRKKEWDGYYYFALTNKQYEKYLYQINKRGRKRKHFEYGPVVIYQSYNECSIREYSKQYIFRIPYITYVRDSYFIENLKSDKAELITIRKPLKFKDIMIQYNKYNDI